MVPDRSRGDQGDQQSHTALADGIRPELSDPGLQRCDYLDVYLQHDDRAGRYQDLERHGQWALYTEVWDATWDILRLLAV